MSTKTSIKRVALVAVSALGFGLLSVVPAKAALAGAGDIDAVIIATTPDVVSTTGVITYNLTVDFHANWADDDDSSFKATVEDPNGDAVAVTASAVGASVTDGADTCALSTSSGTTADIFINCDSTQGSEFEENVVLGSFSYTAAISGDYTITVWHDVDNDGVLDAGETTTDTDDHNYLAVSTGSITYRSSSATSTMPLTDGQVSSIITSTGTSATDVTGTLYWEITSDDAMQFEWRRLTPDLDAAGTAVDPAATSGSFSWTRATSTTTATATQIRIDVTEDTAVAAETLKFCTASPCTVANTIWTITVGTSAGDGLGSTAPFAVNVPDAVANTVYNSAASVTVNQPASTGGYVELLAVQEDVTAYNVAPYSQFVRVTGSTFTFADPESNYTWNLATQPLTPAEVAGATTGTVIAGTLLDDVLRVSTAVAGTIYVDFVVRATVAGVATDTVTQRFTIIVGDLPNAAYSYSTVTITSANNGWKAADKTIYAPATAGTLADSQNVASIKVDQFSTLNAAVTSTGSKAVSLTLTGVGSLAPSVANQTSTSYVAYAAGTSATRTVQVFGDGRAGTGTIAVAVNGVVVETVNLKFYGAATTVEVVPFYTIGREGNGIIGYETGTLDSAAYTGAAGNFAAAAVTPTADNDTAIGVRVVDALGTPVPVAVTVTSSNTGVILAPTTSFLDSGASAAYSAGVWYRHFTFETTSSAKSGQKATLTFTHTLANGTAISATQDLTVGGVPHTETLSLDKASYKAGEAMVVTRKAVDAAGNPVYDGAAAGSVIFNKAIGGTAPAASAYYGGEIVTSASRPSVFAPATSGAFEARMTGKKAGVTSVITATATVESEGTALETSAQAAADAAAEAIDAANAATDAANLAAEAADAATVAAEEARDAADAATAAVEELATQVATLMAALKAQITTLANTVAKIAKKVKA